MVPAALIATVPMMHWEVWPMIRRLVACLTIVAIALAACGGPAATAGPSRTAAVSSSPAQSEAPATPAPTAVPSVATSSYTCSFPVTLPGTAAGPSQAVPTAVRIGKHTDYDRIVFEYSGTVLPALEISAVNPPFTHDPSGLSMTVAGSSFVRIRLEGVKSGVAGRTSFLVQFPALSQLARQGDFEAIQSWIAGLTKPGCVHVSVLTAPARIVIDFQH
jgi:hypothetical protein